MRVDIGRRFRTISFVPPSAWDQMAHRLLVAERDQTSPAVDRIHIKSSERIVELFGLEHTCKVFDTGIAAGVTAVFLVSAVCERLHVANGPTEMSLHCNDIVVSLP